MCLVATKSLTSYAPPLHTNSAQLTLHEAFQPSRCKKTLDPTTIKHRINTWLRPTVTKSLTIPTPPLPLTKAHSVVHKRMNREQKSSKSHDVKPTTYSFVSLSGVINQAARNRSTRQTTWRRMSSVNNISNPK